MGFRLLYRQCPKREKDHEKAQRKLLQPLGGGGFPHLIWKHKGAKSKTRRRVYRANHDPLSCLRNSTLIYNMRGWEYGGGIWYLPLFSSTIIHF